MFGAEVALNAQLHGTQPIPRTCVATRVGVSGRAAGSYRTEDQLIKVCCGERSQVGGWGKDGRG